MVHIIYSVDPTTEFLRPIIDNLTAVGVDTNLIEIQASSESYLEGRQKLLDLPKNSTVLFLGHGQFDKLYGGASSHFNKSTFIDTSSMMCFANTNLFALACDSAHLFKASRFTSGILRSIGFLGLPTEMAEVNKNRRLLEQGIDQSVLDDFKNILVSSISQAFVYYSKNEISNFQILKDYFILLINKEINNSAIVSKKRILADLLYQTRAGISFH